MERTERSASIRTRRVAVVLLALLSLVAGGCTCTAGGTRCQWSDFACVDTDDDDENCGQCGHTCEANQECVAGECVAE
jgi:hypothetical protein